MDHFKQFLRSLSCRLYQFVMLQDPSVQGRDLSGSLKLYFHVIVNRVSYRALYIRYCLGVVFLCL